MYQSNQLTKRSQLVRNSINCSAWRRGLPRKHQLPRIQAMWIICSCHLTALALVVGWLALSPQARATCQDGCLTNSNTALGEDALISNTFGFDNTANGYQALASNTGNS